MAVFESENCRSVVGQTQSRRPTISIRLGEGVHKVSILAMALKWEITEGPKRSYYPKLDVGRQPSAPKLFVAPASRRLSRGHPALAASSNPVCLPSAGGTPAGQPARRRRYKGQLPAKCQLQVLITILHPFPSVQIPE